ncbi:hypothetical protein Tco_0672451 [Tanacetum coccineum]
MGEGEIDNLTMEQYLALTRGNQAPGVDTFSENKNDDAHEHVEQVLDIVTLFNILGVSHDAVMLRVFPITLTGAVKRWTAKQLEKIRNFKQEEDETLYQAWERYNDLLYKCPTHDINSHQKTMADHSQKWHDGSFSRNKESSSNSKGIAAIVNKLENLGRDMKKLKENVHAIQVGCQICGGGHLDKDFPLNEEVRTLSNEVEGQANNGKFKECKTICTKDGSPLYTPFYYYSEEIEYFSANSGFLDDEKQETDNLRMAEALAALEATLKKKRRT